MICLNSIGLVIKKEKNHNKITKNFLLQYDLQRILYVNLTLGLQSPILVVGGVLIDGINKIMNTDILPCQWLKSNNNLLLSNIKGKITCDKLIIKFIKVLVISSTKQLTNLPKMLFKLENTNWTQLLLSPIIPIHYPQRTLK